MRKLKALRNGQQRWEHKGHIYSIVDLTAWPEFTPEPPGSNWDSLMAFYKPYNFELAEVTINNIEVINRYRSFEAAKEGIKRRYP